MYKLKAVVILEDDLYKYETKINRRTIGKKLLGFLKEDPDHPYLQYFGDPIQAHIYPIRASSFSRLIFDLGELDV